MLYGSEHTRDEVFLGRDFSLGDSYSEETAAKIDNEIRRIIDESYQRCKTYIGGHLDKLELVAAYLLKHETMEGDTFRAAMEKDAVTMEELEAIDEAREKQSEEENRRAAEQKKEEETAASQPSDISNEERDLFETLGISLDEPSAEDKNKDQNA